MDTALFDALLLGLAAAVGGAWVAYVVPHMVEAQRRLSLVRRERQEDRRRR